MSCLVKSHAALDLILKDFHLKEVLQLLTHSNSEVRLKACNVVTRLCENRSEEGKKKLLEANVIAAVLPILRTPPLPDILFALLKAIQNFVYESPKTVNAEFRTDIISFSLNHLGTPPVPSTPPSLFESSMPSFPSSMTTQRGRMTFNT
jgi:hypothetical protein